MTGRSSQNHHLMAHHLMLGAEVHAVNFQGYCVTLSTVTTNRVEICLLYIQIFVSYLFHILNSPVVLLFSVLLLLLISAYQWRLSRGGGVSW